MFLHQAPHFPQTSVLIRDLSFDGHPPARSTSHPVPRIPAVAVIRHLGHVAIRQLLLFALHLPARDMRLQPLAEVCRAHACVDDGQDDEDDGENGEGGEGPADGIEDFAMFAGLVHADELEEKVGEAGEVENLWGICVSGVDHGWWSGRKKGSLQ